MIELTKFLRKKISYHRKQHSKATTIRTAIKEESIKLAQFIKSDKASYINQSLFQAFSFNLPWDFRKLLFPCCSKLSGSKFRTYDIVKSSINTRNISWISQERVSNIGLHRQFSLSHYCLKKLLRLMEVFC